MRSFVQLSRRLDGVFRLFQAGLDGIYIARRECCVDVRKKLRQLVQSESSRRAEIALPDGRARVVTSLLSPMQVEREPHSAERFFCGGNVTGQKRSICFGQKPLQHEQRGVTASTG